MGLFDRMRQAQPLANDVEMAATPDMSTAQTPVTTLLGRAFSAAMKSVEADWRLMVETAVIGLGALVLSSLFIWATVTDRVSVEAIVVMIVVLILSMFTVHHGMRYNARHLSLQERARESVAKTTLAAEIMMDFLREFTLKNQATISQMAESHKVRVIDELRTIVDDLGRSLGDGRLRQELAQLEETMARKIMEIPVGVAFPLPRLEYFDQALRHLQEPERTPQCPTCGATQACVSVHDRREGLHYTCTRCGHEFSVGITVMLEKSS
jgi:DNA-directed RNA polymerase subunit M/transcription elongation factor TFIIS